jgi:4a-hydroxytetrahydrobiopterin dehydratase
MDDRITAEEFHAAEGVRDWRIVHDAAHATFGTGTFAAGVRLIDAIAELADEMNHHPDVDLRYATVTVRLRSHDVGGLSQRDVELARRISAAAHELHVTADPRAV